MLKKTGMHVVVAVLLFVVFTAAFSLNALAEDEDPSYESNGFFNYVYSYEYDSVIITGCTQDTDHVVIPSSLETDSGTCHVTGIRSHAAGAWPSGMTSLVLPDSIRDIDVNPWRECDHLQTIEVDPQNPIFESVDGCLYNKMDKSLVCCPNQVESIEIKEGTLKLGYMALGCRENLKYVKIPESLIVIEGTPVVDDDLLDDEISQSELVFEVSPLNSCFAVYDGVLYDTREHKLIYCRPNRRTVQLPPDLKIIPDYAFSSTALEYIDLPDGLQYIGKGAFLSTGLTHIVIPDSVVYVGYGAFEDCIALHSVKLSNSITTVEEKTFSGCPELIHVRIPASIKSIESTAFENNSWRMTGIVDPGSFGEEYCKNQKELDDDVTFVYYDGTDIVETGKLCENCDWTLDISGKLTLTGTGEIQYDPDLIEESDEYSWPEGSVCCTVEIQEGITNIPDGLFYEWTYLRKVEIPHTVTSIGEQAFYHCYSLENLVIPDSVVEIAPGAFEGCEDLELVLPDGAQFDRDALFSNE